MIIIGGGTFGLALAQNLFERARRSGLGSVPEDDQFKPLNYRILVLEAGPFVLPDHTQDVPNLRLFAPAPRPTADTRLPTTRQQLIAEGRADQTFLEVWGLPWNSVEPFGGLAYCLGGRSLYWGGWSPEFLETEMHTAPSGAVTDQTLWPPVVVQDLRARFFREAAEQTGVTSSNDFINGDLHEYYRQQIFQNYAAISDAVPIAELPDYTPDYIQHGGARLQSQLAAPPYPGFVDSLRLDAPLAVQTETRPELFPFSKFSSPPLAIAAARDAVLESGVNNNASKRLMIVPNCHVKRLTTRPYTLATGATVEEVIRIDTSDDSLDLTGTIAGNPNRRPVVILAMGAIESARMALLSVPGVPNGNQIGTDLMVHVRKNAAFTAPYQPCCQI